MGVGESAAQTDRPSEEPLPQQSSASAVSSISANRGVKKGLPNIGLQTAENLASQLWAIARLGTTSKEAYAKQLGAKVASGSTWSTRVALLRGFGLIRIEADKIGLSPLGQQLVN